MKIGGPALCQRPVKRAQFRGMECALGLPIQADRIVRRTLDVVGFCAEHVAPEDGDRPP